MMTIYEEKKGVHSKLVHGFIDIVLPESGVRLKAEASSAISTRVRLQVLSKII